MGWISFQADCLGKTNDGQRFEQLILAGSGVVLESVSVFICGERPRIRCTSS